MSDGENGPTGDDGGTTGAGGDENGLSSLNRYFDALSDSRRRYALYYLDQHGSASVDELARYVTARETGTAPGDLAGPEYDSAKTELHHRHLPRLDDYGLLEFDPRSGMARYREPPRAFAVLLWVSQLIEGRSS